MKRAFTLIELLVVIAIIAILAAILFPVFAQAKDAAKNTSLLSGVKQMGTSTIIYAADADDLFPPTMASHASLPIDLGWQDLCQPYMKNYELVQNLKRTRIPQGTAYTSWLRLQHFGMPGRAVTNTAARPTGYFSGTHIGVVTRYDGIGGFANLSDPAGDWLGRSVASSLSQTQIENISTTALITEGSNWDSWFSLIGNGTTGPQSYCIMWTPVDYNANGAKYSMSITATTKPVSALRSGLDCAIPDGRTTYVATDTSAKSVNYRAFFYAGAPGLTAGVNVTKALNPMGW